MLSFSVICWILIGLLIYSNFGYEPMMLYYLGVFVGLVGIIFKKFDDKDYRTDIENLSQTTAPNPQDILDFIKNNTYPIDNKKQLKTQKDILDESKLSNPYK